MSGPITLDSTDVYHEAILSAINFTASKSYLGTIARLKKLGVSEDDAKTMLMESVTKANPYHDADGKFTTRDKAVFVSTGPAFEASIKKLKAELKKTEVKAKLVKYWDIQKEASIQRKGASLVAKTQKQWDKLTKEEQEAIQGYTGMPGDVLERFLYDRLNTALGRANGDVEKTNAFVREDIKTLDRALSKGKLTENMNLYKALNIGHAGYDGFHSGSDEMDLMNMIGHTIEDTSFSSTSIDLSVAKWFQNHRRVLMQIKVPKGTPGMWVGSDAQRTKFIHEQEFILPRNCGYAVTGVKKIKDSNNEEHVVLLTELKLP